MILFGSRVYCEEVSDSLDSRTQLKYVAGGRVNECDVGNQGQRQATHWVRAEQGVLLHTPRHKAHQMDLEQERKG